MADNLELNGSLTLDNASVQRLLDYGLLNYVGGEWIVERWPEKEARTPTPPAGDVVERVARALCFADYDIEPEHYDEFWTNPRHNHWMMQEGDSWDNDILVRMGREGYRRHATAALAAGSGEREALAQSPEDAELVEASKTQAHLVRQLRLGHHDHLVPMATKVAEAIANRLSGVWE